MPFDTANEFFDENPPLRFDSLVPVPGNHRRPMKVLLETKGLTALELIQLGQDVHTHLTGNANFTTPIPPLATLLTKINTAQTKLDDANMAFDTLRMKRAERRAASADLVQTLESLAGYVQAASGGDEAKILSAGMSVRAPSSPVGPLSAPQDLVVFIGEQEGTCLLEWESLYGASTYIVEYASSPSGPWTNGITVTATRALIGGLTSGAKYFFRVRAVGAAGNSPWSDVAMKMAG